MCYTYVPACGLLASLQKHMKEPVQEHSMPSGCSSLRCWDGVAPLQHRWTLDAGLFVKTAAEQLVPVPNYALTKGGMATDSRMGRVDFTCLIGTPARSYMSPLIHVHEHLLKRGADLAAAPSHALPEAASLSTPGLRAT